MSRLAKQPVVIQTGVDVQLIDRKLSVKGPKGSLVVALTDGVDVNIEDKKLFIKTVGTCESSSFLGLDRSRIANAVLGVTNGFEKKLELVGVGFKALINGKTLDLSLGFSHLVIINIPDNLQIKVEKNTLIVISGIDKWLVGQFAATVRSKKPPEPYKGKGIRYQGEVVRKKAGKKTAK